MYDTMDITALLVESFTRNSDRPKYLALADAVDQVKKDDIKYKYFSEIKLFKCFCYKLFKILRKH